MQKWFVVVTISNTLQIYKLDGHNMKYLVAFK